MTERQENMKIAFAVTEVGPKVAAGDYFTAMELGSSLRKLLRWEVIWLPKEDWYNVGDANVLIAMTDHYDLPRLGPKAAGLVKICWMRNWFDRWAGKPYFGMWDIRLCSSLKAAAHIQKQYGHTSAILRIATNHIRFRPRPQEKLYDYVFTGSYWGAPRDIELIDPAAIGLRFALFGKNWEHHPQFQSYAKGFAPYHAMSRIYNQSRILIDDANNVTKEWGSVNSRVFDALASGTLVITNSATGSAEVFKGHLPVYDSPESLRDILKSYLDNPTLYQSVLEGLRNSILSDHTYDIRAQELAKILLAHLQTTQTRQGERLTSSKPVKITPERSAIVSIIIPVYNQAQFTRNCLNALFNNTPEPYEIIIVDNGSTYDTTILLKQYEGRVRVIRNAQNQGFARACNSGAEAAHAPLLLFLNNDTEVQPGWLPPLLAMASRPTVGAVGSRLLFPDGSIQHAGVLIVERRGVVSLLPRHPFIGENQAEASPVKATSMQAVTAACMLVKAEDFDDVGGFDNAYWNGCEDVDLCFKLAQLGKKVVYEPSSVVVHHEGKSGHERTVAITTNNARLRSRWEGLIAPDICDIDGIIIPAEGLARRIRDGGDLAPDETYGERVSAWWNRYRTRYLSSKQRMTTSNRIAVRICTPSRQSPGWGDTSFGQELATAFARIGHNAEVLFKNEWDYGEHDISIHLRGVYRHYPRSGGKNILWIISHPELITKDELDSYDLVFCASSYFLRQIELITSTPCYFLPQAAHHGFVMKKRQPSATQLDLLFVGNNYAYKENRRRQIVQDVLDAGQGASLRVIGRDWKGYLPAAMLLDEFVPQEILPRFYSMARINLNDHHPAMARDGFINNRTYDIGALGLFQISNAVPGIDDLGVVTYTNAKDLRHKIDYYINNENLRKEIAAYSRENCIKETFEARVKKIIDII